MTTPMLRVQDLKVHFPIKKGFFEKEQQFVYAVNGVSFEIKEGETLGIVGESGCGKTTTGMSVINLEEVTSGSVNFLGRDITHIKNLPWKEQLQIRKDIQMIFQDPYSSLNPRTTLHRILDEPMKVRGLYPNKTERNDRIEFLLNRIGLTMDQATRYPHSFSGGQRQRIGIARALCLNPKLIIGDEPVSALDVSIQAQIINLLVDLQDEFNLTYIIIAHDLAVVEHIADRIAVMYLGKIVEIGPYDQLYSNPSHPYTQALISAIPDPDPDSQRERIILTGDVPSPRNPPKGCAFHPRCTKKIKECEFLIPETKDLGNEHFVSCHLYHNQG